MPVNLPSVAVSTTPTVIKTFFQHYITQMKKEKEDRKTEATDELMFHEAFAIVKRFIDIATNDTVEALQRFTNTRVPAQPGSTTLQVLVPMSSCNQAAELLIEYFGEKDLTNVVGGSRWWQVRGLNGVQGEWIAKTEDWRRAEKVEEYEANEGDKETLKRKAREAKKNYRHERKRSSHFMPKRSRSKTGNEVKSEKKSRSSMESTRALDESKDEPPESFEELDRLRRVMYYVHGGGYYFGSISTHRLMITRFARKFGGRAFALSYRKAPNYPWPCPVQDALAGYLYLIDPPPEAKHKAIDPAHIVIAGDSAGGGLALALLGVLRDLQKPMPAGAVLLSPWCDLTHSFPSILQNTETDIIPRYSFIHKPSTLWPVPGVRPEDKQKTATESQGKRGESGNDASDPPDTKAGGAKSHKDDCKPDMAVPHGVGKNIRDGKVRKDMKKEDTDNLAIRDARHSLESPDAEQTTTPIHETNGAMEEEEEGPIIPNALDHLYSDPLTIPLKTEDGKDINIELRQQIQLYATNAQLYHPLCSPILQGSLGGLPPLYILAGNSEVLRDEIIYLAHRAARPEQYPLKKELLEASERCRHDAERFNKTPTKVHLQVYDGQPHVLTLFSFTTSARYAYRAIASFVKHVTGAPTNIINPFPHLENSLPLHNQTSDAPSNPETHETIKESQKVEVAPIDTSGISTPTARASDSPVPMSATSAHDENGTSTDSQPSSTVVDAPLHGETLRQKKRRDVTLGIENAYDGQVPLRRPSYVQEMIRERVDIRGLIRPLEPEQQLQALQVPIDEIGKIKAGPVSRYLTGQELWDKKYRRTAKKVDKERAKNEDRARAMLEQAAKEGLLDSSNIPTLKGTNRKRGMTNVSTRSNIDQEEKTWKEEGWADLATFGPLDLQGEVPPPSAIAGRRDTPDALELLRQSLHMRAHRLYKGSEARNIAAKVSYGSSRAGIRGKSKIRMREATGGSWGQSAAERQVEAKSGYGLRAWGDAMNYFTGKSNKKLEKVKQKAATENSHESNKSNVNADGHKDADTGEWIEASSQ